MTVSFPFSAPACPPDTGASRNSTCRARGAGDLPRDLRGRRGVIDEDRLRRHPRERVLRDRAHVVVVADAHQHDLRIARGVGRGRRRLAAVLLDPLPRLRLRAVVDRHVVARLREMSGHRVAHDAESEEREFLAHR
jgi:hypothetical protein